MQNAPAGTSPVVSNYVWEQLVGVLDLNGARLEYGALLGHQPRLEPGTLDRAWLPHRLDP